MKTVEPEYIDQIKSKCILMFSANWCGPCQNLKPQMEILNVKDDNKEIDILYIDIDKEFDIIDELEITKIPAIYIYEPEQELNKNDILVSSDINIVKNHLKKKFQITETLVFDDNF